MIVSGRVEHSLLYAAFVNWMTGIETCMQHVEHENPSSLGNR